jgi:hypothetical protein
MEQPRTPAARAYWTLARQRLFLVALLDSGCVARAARAVGMSRVSAYKLRRRLAGTLFDRSWDFALAQHGRFRADPFAPDLPVDPAAGL